MSQALLQEHIRILSPGALTARYTYTKYITHLP
jgi:hypothetical protein